MAKPKIVGESLQVLVGINVRDPENRGKELRFEPGDRVPLSLLRPETIEALLAQGVLGIGE